MRTGAVLLLLAGCGPAPNRDASLAGERLERAAQAAGLVGAADGALTGSWARGSDRMCVAAPDAGGTQRVGLVLDYGPGNGCSAQGLLRRNGEGAELELGACRATARVDGDRLVLPARLDEACAALCRGNATLAALRVERLSDSPAEAAAFRLPDGRRPCGD